MSLFQVRLSSQHISHSLSLSMCNSPRDWEPMPSFCWKARKNMSRMPKIAQPGHRKLIQRKFVAREQIVRKHQYRPSHGESSFFTTGLISAIRQRSSLEGLCKLFVPMPCEGPALRREIWCTPILTMDHRPMVHSWQTGMRSCQFDLTHTRCLFADIGASCLYRSSPKDR